MEKKIKNWVIFGFLVFFITLLSWLFLIGNFPIKTSFAETIEEEVSSTSEEAVGSTSEEEVSSTSEEEVSLIPENSEENIKLNLLKEEIKEIKGTFGNRVFCRIYSDELGNELWLFDLESEKIKKIGSQDFGPTEDFPIGLKENFVFWLSKDRDKVFAFDFIKEKFYQESLPYFDPEKGERAKINFPEIPWTVIVDNFNFYFFSPETGEVFSDGNSEVLENFRQKFNLDKFLTKEKLSDLGFSVNWENE
jgi:hypothetical protein